LGDGGLACLDATNGNEVWTSREATSESYGNAHLTPNGDRVFLFNQKGHLILARLAPEGYQELGRCLLVEPTAGYRAQDRVTWAHPAYANQHVFARNDRELVCASLAAGESSTTGAPRSSLTIASRPLADMNGPVAPAQCVAVSADGNTIALGSINGTIRLQELSTGNALPAPDPHNDWVCSVALSQDGKYLVSAGGSEFKPARNGNMTSAEIKVWDLMTNMERGRLEGHTNKVFSAAFSSDNMTLATGSADQTVRLWDIETMTERAVLKGHTDAVSCVAFSDDGQTLASASWDRTIRIWDVSSGAELGTLLGHDEEVLAVSISPDRETIATGSADWTVRLWNLATKQQTVVLNGHRGAVYCVKFSTDGKTLFTGSGDQTIKLWNVQTKTEMGTLNGHESGVSSLAFTPGDQVLVSASMDDDVRLWSLRSAEK
jgi:WD40 repeat protein